MTIQAWKAAGQTFTYKGHRIFYRSEGKGPDLIILHGFPTASWDWWKMWPQLTQQFTVHAPDFLGFGYSDKPKSYAYSMVDQASLLEALANHLNVQQAHLLCHDYGNSVGQELLARALSKESGALGFKILSCCFLNGGLFPESHHPRLIQKVLASPVGPYLHAFITKQSLERNFKAIFGPQTPPTDQEIDEFWALIMEQQGKRVIPKLLGYLRERREQRSRWVGALEQTKVPLGMINGPEDPISGRHLAEAFRACRPDAYYQLLEGIGHYPQTEAPEAVSEAFSEFHRSLG